MRKTKALKTFRVHFVEPVACVTIRAANAKEARTIAQNYYDRGELTTDYFGDDEEEKLLPEGRSIAAEFFDPGDWEPFIDSAEEAVDE